MKTKTVITINDSNNINYKNNMRRAIDLLEMAIHNISYVNAVDEDTNKPLNVDIIKRLNNVIYELEDCLEIPIVKIFCIQGEQDEYKY